MFLKLFLENLGISEAVAGRCSIKKVFSEISQNLQENTCARVPFLIQLENLNATLFKKRLWHRFFPVNFVKFLRTHFLQNTSGDCFWNFRLVLETARSDCSPKFYNHLKIEPVFSKFSHSLLQMSTVLGSFLGSFILAHNCLIGCFFNLLKTPSTIPMDERN